MDRKEGSASRIIVLEEMRAKVTEETKQVAATLSEYKVGNNNLHEQVAKYEVTSLAALGVYR